MESTRQTGPPAKAPLWDLTAWRAMYPGMWAWLFQRLSALALIVLFPIHVMKPYIDWLRITMLLLVVFHSMHGVKVILTDFGFPARHQRKLLWVLTAAGAALFVWLFWLHREYWRFFS